MKASSQHKAALIAGGLLWLLAVGSGSLVMINYAHTPGSQSPSPTQWPQHSGMTLDAKVPTLVLFAHPHCPCTRASMGELARLMACAQGRIRAYVLFFKPEGSAKDWTETDLWRRAAEIPGVGVAVDDNGREAERFGVSTSGHTAVYNSAGRLMFQGGITAARGHSGDNAGRSAILDLVDRGVTAQTQTPVFGCSMRCSQTADGKNLPSPGQ